MRISDWSSDVCSSDLLFGELDRLDEIMRRIEMEQRHEPAIDAHRGHLIAALDRADQFDRFAREGVGQPRDPALRAEHQPFERNIVEPREQNGRASCRARVCQYVSISGGAVSIKKKKKNK